MLELSESYTISRQITKHLRGKRIGRIEILHSPHKFAFFNGNLERYAHLLEGQTILTATYQGGMIEVHTEDTMLFLADGATPKYHEEVKNIPKKHQFLLEFDDGSAVTVTIQMYGIFGVYPIGQCDDGYYISSSSKRNPLSQEFTFDYFQGLYQPGKKISAKAFLATEQRIPGLGNGVLQDILWNASLDPRFKMQDIQETEFFTLYESVRQKLKEMCLSGGRDTERDLFGNKGGYITKMSKYTVNQPCMKCGYEVHKLNYMGGTVYVCEHCQKR